MNEEKDRENIKNFVDIATNYCQLIDNHQNLDRLFFLDELNKILPMLYYRSLFLPSIDLDFIFGNLKIKLSSLIPHPSYFIPTQTSIDLF